jgi:fucose 4-O-acetylase-like acetyltransferase
VTDTAPATRVDPRPAATPTDRAPRPGGGRDPWFDNVKMTLVTLVVVGHAWVLVPPTLVNDTLYDWLYLWHMPAFVMVTGYLSRRFRYEPGKMRRLVTTVLLPYLVFEGALALYRTHVGGENLERLWINPHWAMWFLVALLIWRLATPLLLRLGAWALPVSVAVSLLGGLVDVELLDINRVMGLLPFYTLGLVVRGHHLRRLRTERARKVAIPVLLAGLAVVGYVNGVLSTEWLYYRSPYEALEVGALFGVANRALLLAVAVAMAAAALAWIPGRDGWYARMGAASLVVYLFHGFFVRGAEYAGFGGWAEGHPVLSLVLATAAGVGISLLLAWRPVRKPLEKVVTPDP